MKRAIGFGLLIIACIASFLTVKGTLPFMPIFGSSMEPTLHSGALMIIKSIDPYNVKVGDIIVYNVPSSVRAYYNYPSVVSHRVIKVTTAPTLGFRTKGDNTGEDPFTIRPQDIRGTVGSQIPYLGLPMLFMQSKQGMIFVILGLVLLAIFLYGGELLRGGNFLHRGVFGPVIAEEKRTNRLLTRKIEAGEKKMDSTEQALEKFSVAIGDYAQNLASHTSAVKSLAEASHDLKQSAAQQNRVLMTLMQNMNKGNIPFEMPEVPPPPEIKEVKQPPRYEAATGKVESPKPSARAKKAHLPERLPEETVKLVQRSSQSIPGCVRTRKEPEAKKELETKKTPEIKAAAAKKEPSATLNKVHRKLDRKS